MLIRAMINDAAQPTRCRYVAITKTRLKAIQKAAVPNRTAEKLMISSTVLVRVMRAAMDRTMLPMKRPKVPAWCTRVVIKFKSASRTVLQVEHRQDMLYFSDRICQEGAPCMLACSGWHSRNAWGKGWCTAPCARACLRAHEPGVEQALGQALINDLRKHQAMTQLTALP